MNDGNTSVLRIRISGGMADRHVDRAVFHGQEVNGYNEHLPGIKELKEKKRLERMVTWMKREAIKQSLRAIRAEIGTEAFVKERLHGSLRAVDMERFDAKADEC